tara:strand:- start:352 stop:2730 length:2379 start_codon:yes stop_codon:yes gene_type:complete
MKFTKDWLQNHLKTNKNESQIIEKLNNIGLEVENVEENKNELSDFIVAKIVKADKHPNADRLKLCKVDIGNKKLVDVVCGAPNASENLLTIYAPPGSIIPKNQMKLQITKIRGVTSYGMLCSEAELNLSNESEGIVALNKKYLSKIGSSYFKNSKTNTIELSITPNRPDCLGIRGIARDLAACEIGNLKELKIKKIKKSTKHNLKIVINKNNKQACSIFGSCIIRNIKNAESPSWLKKRIVSLGLRPISAVVDVTNYVMFDLNRPLHAYDIDKVKNKIIVRNSNNGESFEALDNKNYNLQNNMCVISDDEGILGLGGIIGGTRSSTKLETKNILLESAYFDPEITRKTAKKLNINSDAKFRFERGIDPNSIEIGLQEAARLIIEICGGELSDIDIQQTKKFEKKIIKFDPNIVAKTIGIKIANKEIIKILNSLGFVIKKKANIINVIVPSWRPDIFGEIDLVEEIIRIKGLDKLESISPEKNRLKPTLNYYQRHFHLGQRSVASKGYLETITWSFTDEKINNKFIGEKEVVKIINPISTDLNVLRSSLYPNLIYYLEKNLNRGFGDQSLFEIGPAFTGRNPGDQITIICAIKKQQIDEDNYLKKEPIDVFKIKADVIKTLLELGVNKGNTTIVTKTPSYYHPGISGSIFSKDKKNLFAHFGQIHPGIISNSYGFEIFLENLVKYKQNFKQELKSLAFSDYQKSDRDFAFLISKNTEAQVLTEIIQNIDRTLIKNVRVFDVYEGPNIDDDKKSIALKVTIQSDNKTLDEKDLNDISKKIIKTVEDKAQAKLRS